MMILLVLYMCVCVCHCIWMGNSISNIYNLYLCLNILFIFWCYYSRISLNGLFIYLEDEMWFGHSDTNTHTDTMSIIQAHKRPVVDSRVLFELSL